MNNQMKKYSRIQDYDVSKNFVIFLVIKDNVLKNINFN